MANNWRAVVVRPNDTPGEVDWNDNFATSDLGAAADGMILAVIQDSTALVQGQQNTVFNSLRKAFDAFMDSGATLSVDESTAYTKFHGAKVSLTSGSPLKPEIFKTATNVLAVGDFTEPSVMVLVGNDFNDDPFDAETSLPTGLASSTASSGCVIDVSTVSGGGITAATVATAGSGYIVGEKLKIVGGTGTGGILTVSTVNASGGVTAVAVSTAGTGYVVGDDGLATTSGTGATFNVTAVSYDGRISTAAVNAGGTGYIVGSVLTLTGGGASTNAVFTVSTVNGSGAVTAFTITNDGLGYNGAVRSVDGHTLRFRSAFDTGMKRLREKFKAY